MKGRFGTSVMAVMAGGLMFAATASAATLADWEMNEASGAKVMVDSSGHVNGTIGSAVKTGVGTHGRAPPTSGRSPARPRRRPSRSDWCRQTARP